MSLGKRNVIADGGVRFVRHDGRRFVLDAHALSKAPAQVFVHTRYSVGAPCADMLLLYADAAGTTPVGAAHQEQRPI